jgi:lipopolysaccharide transport system ATP-binding protein
MGTITVTKLGKAYKQYPNRWSRLFEWILPAKFKRHQLKWVLHDINFIIQHGEAVGIMGVNGAGKSTLLKLITGTTQPTTGNVNVSGRVAALLELGMGFHPEFTGRQNAFLAGQLMGITNIDITRLMPEIEAFAEIGNYIDQPVRIYSSGMQMRLAFSVATVIRPDILIIDEALAVGDAYFQAKCYQRIKTFKEHGTTLLLVSHSPGDVVKHCDRALLIKNGVVELDGPSRDVSNLYLDELFGKKSSSLTERKTLVNLRVKNALPYDILLSAKNDIFYSRPGYRKEEYRWGHGGAAILDYLVVADEQQYPSRIEGNIIADFFFKVRFDTDFDSVVPGFLIKTIEGLFLYGTNSLISNKIIEVISVSAGDIKVFRFSLPLALNEGHYLISFGISTGYPASELVPLDRRYDSVLIHVGRDSQFWGIVDLDAEFECFQSVIEVFAE